MAIEKVIIIRGDTKQAQKSFEQLGDTIEEQKQITIEFEKELADLERQLKQTGNLSRQKRLRTEINKRRDAIKDNRLALKELNFERNKIKAVDRQAKASKKLNQTYFDSKESLTDVNRLTAEFALKIKAARNILVSSVQAVVKFVRGLSGLKTALLATGVGALVVALGFVVEFWDEILDFINGTNKALEKQIKLNERNVEVLEGQIEILEAEEKLLEAQGKSTEEIRKEREKILELQITETENLITNLELRLREKQLDVLRISFWQRAENISRRILGQPPIVIGDISEKDVKALEEIEDAVTDAKVSLRELKTEIINLNKETEEEKKKKTKPEKQTEEEKAEEKRLKKLEALRRKFEEKERDQDAQTKLEKINLEEQRVLEELEALGGSEEQKIAILLFFADERIRLEEEQQEKRDAIAEKNREKQEQEDKKETQRRLKKLEKDARLELKIERELIEAKLGIQNSVIDNAKQTFEILRQLGEENKTLQAIALIGENAAGIARIVVNTQAANAKAVLASPLTLGQPWVAINTVSAGLGIASSIAATAKGLSALRKSGNTGQGVSADTGGGGGAPPVAPEFNIIGTSPENQLAQTIAQQVQAPIEAFVVANKVTTQQSMDRNTIKTAAFP